MIFNTLLLALIRMYIYVGNGNFKRDFDPLQNVE